MSKVGLFFGSDEGNTQRVAALIAASLGEHNVDVYDVADVTQTEFGLYDNIILGISTWDFGQIQSDWEEFWNDIEEVDFTGKTVALYGLGDQFGYGDFFLDAMGMLYDVVIAGGARVVGYWPIDGYSFDASKALLDDGSHFAGLAIDEDQQPELTQERVDRWVSQIREPMGLA